MTNGNIVHMPRATEPPPLLRALAERVRDLRARRGVTLRDLAQASGLSLRFLGQIEAGRGNVSVLKLAQLAEALGTTPAGLLTARRSPRPIVCLLGLRGAGKTTVGRRLARLLHVPFVELDRRIEEMAGLGLPEIFAIHGEAYYRRLEHQTLERVLSEDRAIVLAAGGGIVTAPEAYGLLRQRTVTVWLRATVRDHLSRVRHQGDRRAGGDDAEAVEQLRRLMSSREALFSQATHTIDTSRLTADAAARAIEARLRR